MAEMSYAVKVDGDYVVGLYDQRVATSKNAHFDDAINIHLPSRVSSFAHIIKAHAKEGAAITIASRDVDTTVVTLEAWDEAHQD